MGKDTKESGDKYSLRGKVYDRIREDILNGVYKEHEELKEATLGKMMDVSRTPVREALRQLELEGLVEIIPNKGARVTGITKKDIEDMEDILSSKSRVKKIIVEELTKVSEKYGRDRNSEIIYDTDTEEEFGTLTDVLQTGANDVWHIQKEGKEYLIPAIPLVVDTVDVDSGRVTITPLKGIFEDED